MLAPVVTVAVDDGSTDGTRQVLQGLAARDPRVEVLDGQDRGLVAAPRLALSQATSPYVARMVADDAALPRWLEASVVALEADSRLHPRKVGTRIQGIPVVSGEELDPPGDGLLPLCVGVRWAREALRTDLATRGWVEGVDFLCAA
jgi:glycosyltransferase involved in cell wall biosynthesis